MIVVSQSGETADTLAALKHAKALGHAHTLTICNVPTSSMVRQTELTYLTRAGVVFETPPEDQTWLWREAWLRDPTGNRVCLFHAGANRIDPPWRVTS